MRTRSIDPLPHNHTAFYCFDAALEAYHLAPPGEHNGTNYFYHRDDNQRRYMIRVLRAEGGSESLIYEWLESLSQQIKLPHSPEESN